MRLNSTLLLTARRERQLGVHVAAVVTRTMRKLGVAALRTADVMNWLKRLMRTSFALARLADPLNGKHSNTSKSRADKSRTGAASSKPSNRPRRILPTVIVIIRKKATAG